MLALIAGTGDLPQVLLRRLDQQPLVCALAGHDVSVDVEMTFRIEGLGSFLDVLKDRGVTSICMAGAIDRPVMDPAVVDAQTHTLLPRLRRALVGGDDAALRELISIFEDAGLNVKGADEIVPSLLPQEGVLTTAQPASWHREDADVGQRTIAALGASDTGQACIIRMGQVAATEEADGTDAMLARFHETYLGPPHQTIGAVLKKATSDFVNYISDLVSGKTATPVTADDGILFKAPKPQQDRRVDLPVIGLQTAMNAAEAGLAGIVIEAGGVIVLNQIAVIDTLNAQGMFLWVRPRSET